MPDTIASPKRPIRRALAGMAAAAAVLTAGLGNTPGATAAPVARQNIIGTAAATGQFKTLLSLAKQAGLVRALSGPGPLTLFAPTDAAFKAVPKATLRQLATNQTALRRVLLYHVVKGDVTAARVVKFKSTKTLAGPEDQHPGARRVGLPQRLDEGREDRHPREQRNDPHHQQGIAAADELAALDVRREAGLHAASRLRLFEQHQDLARLRRRIPTRLRRHRVGLAPLRRSRSTTGPSPRPPGLRHESARHRPERAPTRPVESDRRHLRGYERVGFVILARARDAEPEIARPDGGQARHHAICEGGVDRSVDAGRCRGPVFLFR